MVGLFHAVSELESSSAQRVLLILDVWVLDSYDAITNSVVLRCGSALTKHLL